MNTVLAKLGTAVSMDSGLRRNDEKEKGRAGLSPTRPFGT
jgi:hypothetical protein